MRKFNISYEQDAQSDILNFLHAQVLQICESFTAIIWLQFLELLLMDEWVIEY